MTRQNEHKGFLRDDRGAVAATYALALIPLIAAIGLGFDYARVMGMDTELQNAADQAALAGASQLDQRSDSMTRAINAATGNLVSNQTIFSNDGSGGTVAVTDTSTQVIFYANKADAESGQNGFTDTSNFANARFVEVIVDTRAANYAFTPIVGLLTGSLNAGAVAGIGSAICRIPPLMICNPDEDPNVTNPEMIVANHIGKGLLAKPGGGSGGWGPGAYGYLDIGPNGAIGVRQALGWNDPPGNCLAVDGADPLTDVEVDAQAGNVASGPQAINTRFDIYSTQGCVGSGTCSPAANVRKDIVRPVTPAANTGTCDYAANPSAAGNGWREPNNPYRPTTLGPYLGTIGSMGHPRDICHALRDDNVLNCKSTFFGNGIWDRDAYFRTHYVRTVDTANGLAGSSWTNADWMRELSGEAANGTANITRFEVYEWELDNEGSTVDGVPILADTPAGATGSTLTTRNKPVCGATHGFGSFARDRRKMSVAVVNCTEHADELQNKKNIPVRQFIDVFLVQPSLDRPNDGKFTQKDEIYVEIIGVSEIRSDGANIGTTFRRDVPYLVR